MSKFTDPVHSAPKNSPAMKTGTAGKKMGSIKSKEEFSDDHDDQPRNSPPLREKPELEGTGTLKTGADIHGFGEGDLRKGFKSLKMPAATGNSPDKGGFNSRDED